jgi:hypothetical protein
MKMAMPNFPKPSAECLIFYACTMTEHKTGHCSFWVEMLLDCFNILATKASATFQAPDLYPDGIFLTTKRIS